MLPLVAEEKTIKSAASVLNNPGGFYLEASDLPLWQVCQELSVYFNKNIVVYKDSKDLKISCNLRDLTLKKSLDLISWLSGVEWYERDNVYYLGGNKDYIEVLDNTGISADVCSVFGKSSVKLVEDKVIIAGSEREVKRISAAIKQLQKKEYVTVRVWGYEVTEEKAIKLGLDIEKALKYSFSWEGIVTHMYNPIQNLVLSLEASLEANQSQSDLYLIVNTQITCVSGKKQKLVVGEAVDRELYSTSEYGKVFVSGYSTLQTGYTLNLSCFKYDAGAWLFDIGIENSVEQSDVRRNNVQMSNTVVLSDKFPALVGRIIKNYQAVDYDKGFPFLADIPGFGYLFRVTDEKESKRNVLFFMQVVQGAGTDAGATAPPARPAPAQLLDLNFDLQSFF